MYSSFTLFKQDYYMYKKSKYIISLVAFSFILLSGCGGSSSSDGDSTTLEKVLEHLDIEPGTITEVVDTLDSLLTDGSLTALTDEQDVFSFTATESGNYSYYLDVPTGNDYDITVSVNGSVVDVSAASGDTDESGVFSMQAGETGSISVEYWNGTNTVLYFLDLAKPSEPAASLYSGSTVTDPVITDPVSTGTQLSCSDYGNGMCAVYTFTVAADADLFTSACTVATPTCSTSSLVGICDTGTDATTGGTGDVQSDLWLYSPSFTAAGAQSICEGLSPAGVWRVNP